MHPQWTYQPGTCRLQRQFWTTTWGIPLGEVQIRIWYLCGWGSGIVSLFLHNQSNQLLMIMNIIFRHLNHWVCHWIWVSRCYWGQTMWSKMLLLIIPQNLLGLVWKNWRGWSIEYHERQELGLPVYIDCFCYVWVGYGVLHILWWTQWWSIRSLCLSPEICGLGIGRKHSGTQRISRIIQCPVVRHSLHGYIWRGNWKLLKGGGGACISEKLYRLREVFPMTPILPSSKVLDVVSAGVLAITSAGISNVACGKGGEREQYNIYHCSYDYLEVIISVMPNPWYQ